MNQFFRVLRDFIAIITVTQLVFACANPDEHSVASSAVILNDTGSSEDLLSSPELLKALEECSERGRNLSGMSAIFNWSGGVSGGIGGILLGMASIGEFFTPIGWVMVGLGATASIVGNSVKMESLVRNCGAIDVDLAGYDGDWSWRRVKRSCPPGQSIEATHHDHDFPGNLDVRCGNLAFVSEEERPQYRYVENGRMLGALRMPETRWGYSLDCSANEYLAGISYSVTWLYGIKSILCAQRPDGERQGSCRYMGDGSQSCPAGHYMNGMYLARAHREQAMMGVFVSTDGRADDVAEYGDHIKGVSCCSY